ncbi:hypothetical protein C8R44DRAFT_727899 [Mycena epipterygia]|nr:hypothetical protein C8R44DRAFT_727899 [Mycena epipterygia]
MVHAIVLKTTQRRRDSTSTADPTADPTLGPSARPTPRPQVAEQSMYFTASVKRELVAYTYWKLGNVDTRIHAGGGAGAKTSRKRFHDDFIAHQSNSNLEACFRAYLPKDYRVPSIFAAKKIREALSPVAFDVGNSAIHDLSFDTVHRFLQALRAGSPSDAASGVVWETLVVALVGRPYDATDWEGNTAQFQDAIRRHTSMPGLDYISKANTFLNAAATFEVLRQKESYRDFEAALGRRGFSMSSPQGQVFWLWVVIIILVGLILADHATKPGWHEVEDMIRRSKDT